MREIRLSGSEGGGTGNSTGSPYPYPANIAGDCSGPCPRSKSEGKENDRSHAPAWERSPSDASASRWDAGPARRMVRGMTGLRGRKQPFGAEPGGGVRNREKGANCLSAASFCPAGSAARRPGSSQRQGCPFAVVWRRPHDGFFSLGRQRKERHPARGAADLVTLERPGRRSHAGA